MRKTEHKFTLFENLVTLKNENPNQTAFAYMDRRNLIEKSYMETYQKVCACRFFYKNCGKSRIGLLGSNSWEWICHAWGMTAAGMTVALLDPLLPAEDMVSAVQRSDLDMIVRETALSELDSVLLKAVPDLTIQGYCSRAFEEADAVEQTDEGDFLFFTSGTTKNSKIVVTPAAAIAGQIRAHEQLIHHKSGETCMIPLPYHHSFGFASLNLYFSFKNCIFISTMKSMYMDLKKALPYTMVLVPSALEFLIKKGSAAFLQVRSILTAGAVCPPNVEKAVKEKGIVLQNNYGSSELPGGIADSLPEDEIGTLTLHPYVTVEFSSDGELIVTNPYHFSEYYNNEEDTLETMRNGKIYTGDAAYLDENGKLHLLGRKKNIIVMKNGEKIFCTDVDFELSQLEGVKEGAVLYIEHELIAVLEPEDGVSDECLNQQIEVYNQLQPYYRRMKKVWIHRSSLPYTSSGKMNRHKLEVEYRENEC